MILNAGQCPACREEELVKQIFGWKRWKCWLCSSSILDSCCKYHSLYQFSPFWWVKLLTLVHSFVGIENEITALLIFIKLLIFVASDLPKVTAVVGIWGWTAVSLAVAALLMFIRCSRYNVEISLDVMYKPAIRFWSLCILLFLFVFLSIPTPQMPLHCSYW